MRSCCIAFIAVIAWAIPAHAAPQDVATEIAGEIMSPYCDGVTLHDCPSPAAAELRNQIERWAQQGWTKPRIIAELENRFGERIHAAPRSSEGVAAWALPVAAALVGLVGLAILVARWTPRTENVAPVDPVDHARVERELAALRKEAT